MTADRQQDRHDGLCFHEAIVQTFSDESSRASLGDAEIEAAKNLFFATLHKFSLVHGGQYWYVRQGKAAERAARNRLIYLELCRDGSIANIRSLGRAHNLSIHHLRRIFKVERERG